MEPRPRAVHAPAVSVVIPTVSQAAHLSSCLASLQAHTPPSSIEIVVVLNGASADVRDVVGLTRGIRVVESAVNRGFAGGCHLGVRAASGDCLLFLNDDVQVTPGWLAPLLETVRRARVGAVAPRVLAPDGTVQEIGSVIWRDGTTRPIGRGLPGSSVAWRWRRRVDYASACALLVRRDAWDAAGGFDAGYHPAYYEDVDFCLGLEQAGYEVWVDPRSDVVHAESASTMPAFKQFLFARHHARLVSSRSAALVHRQPAPVSPGLVPAAERAAVSRLQSPGLRVLVVDDRVPRHGIGSGFDRMADVVLSLAAHGVQVTCLATGSPPEFVPALARAGVEVLDDDPEAALAAALSTCDLVLVSRPNNAAVVQRALDAMAPGDRPTYVYDAEALYHRRVERQAALGDADTAPPLQAQAAQWRAIEHGVAAHADAVVCVSSDEADFFRRAGAAAVHVRTPWLRQSTLTDSSLAGRADLGFAAGWLAGEGSPNADGLDWFAREVLPLVADAVPWVRLRVTGTLPPSLRRLEGPHLRAEGFVSDLAGFYRQLRVAVVPLRFGAGVKLKTVEAVQHGVPIVATGIGAEGLDELGACIAVHDEPGAFAAAVAARLLDASVWREHRRRIEAALAAVPRDREWSELLASLAVEKTRDVDRAV